MKNHNYHLTFTKTIGKMIEYQCILLLLKNYFILKLIKFTFHIITQLKYKVIN